MLKIGLLGAGFMGNTHALCYDSMKHRDIQVTAVADLNPAKAAEAAGLFGAKAYASANALLEKEDVDVVDICLPTFLHKEYILKAIRKGCHILCEKPVTLTPEESDAVLRAAEGYDKKIMVAHCIRFWPEYQFLYDCVRSGEMGKLLSAVFMRINPRRKPGTAWEDWIVDSARSGSGVIDLSIHDTDFIRYLLGEPRKFQSAAYENHNNPEHIFAHYIFDSAVVSTEAGWDYPSGIFPSARSYRAVFEKGAVAFDTKVRIYKENGERIEPNISYPEITPSEKTGNVAGLYGYYNEIEYFIDCIQNNKNTEKCSLSDSCRSLRLVYDVYESALGI